MSEHDSQSDIPGSGLSTREILAARGPKNTVDPMRPYAYLVENERSAAGRIEPVATLFLTNRECPFRCLYCDLWKNTTDVTLVPGLIPQQIEFALSQLPPAPHIKLYNSGNFFDERAIPVEDHARIAELVQGFLTVIVENHPRLTDQRAVELRKRLSGEFEVALGLETIHPDVLPRLNKGMTLDDFDRAAGFLRDNQIEVRAFILLRPPFLTEEQGVEWALKSIEHAFAQGARVCCVIPTRDGNGIMEQLGREGRYAPPGLSSLERVLEAALLWNQGRVFVDLWDARRFATCEFCADARIERLRRMNHSQQIVPAIPCDVCQPR
jgi:radical SAM enzyme (TIGR01210 family)